LDERLDDTSASIYSDVRYLSAYLKALPGFLETLDKLIKEKESRNEQ
jgi:hypothetical protein